MYVILIFRQSTHCFFLKDNRNILNSLNQAIAKNWMYIVVMASYIFPESVRTEFIELHFSLYYIIYLWVLFAPKKN